MIIQHGGGVPFSALKKKGKNKTKKKPKRPKRPKRSKKPKKPKRSTKKSVKPIKCSCGTHTYTGKEDTPRGFGRCEECIPDNVVLLGTDKKLYKNIRGSWKKIKIQDR